MEHLADVDLSTVRKSETRVHTPQLAKICAKAACGDLVADGLDPELALVQTDF